jgi:hypothetical protein
MTALDTQHMDKLNHAIMTLASKVRLGEVPEIALASDAKRPGSGRRMSFGVLGKLFDSRKGVNYSHTVLFLNFFAAL